MRIAHIVESTFAGVGRHVLDLAGLQQLVGHDTLVIFSPERESDSFRAERQELQGTVTFVPVLMRRSPARRTGASFGTLDVR